MAVVTSKSTDANTDELFVDLQAEVGSIGSPDTARDPVNIATIRNWCDAIGEANPVFTDPETAEASVHTGLVAPPAMLNVWTMYGLHLGAERPRDPNEPRVGAYEKLDQAGYSSVVATNSDLYFNRYLKPGDLVIGTTKLLEVSERKTTRLGTGYFVTTESTYVDQNGDTVGSMRFRILKYRSPSSADAAESGNGDGADSNGSADPASKPRPRPKFNQDQAWFWEGLRQGELRIQRFTDDGTLIHPPANANPGTGHMDYDWIVASGEATLYSYTVVHHPQIPSFDYPNIVGLVELAEGVRIVSNIVGVTPKQLEVGMPLELCFTDTHDDVTLHQFRPARQVRNESTLTVDQVAVGDQLPLGPVPIDPLLIVSAAIATRDFQPVHHNYHLARSRGTPDIFMNILTTSGIVTRWLGDWAGNDVVFKNLKIGLGAPNFPGDLMTLSGTVTEVGDHGRIAVGFIGRNELGAHVTGTAEMVLPVVDGNADESKGGR